MNQNFLSSWKNYVYNIDSVLEQMQKQRIISVGIPPYPRIMPALFLPKECYYLYCTKASADLEVLRNYANVVCLEDTNKELAPKVQSTGYLLKNFAFQKFLQTVPKPYSLLFFQTTAPIIENIKQQGIPWLGNEPESFEPVYHKEGFRKVLKQLGVTLLPDFILSVPDFLNRNCDALFARWQCPFVCQAGDYEVSGGTYFVRSNEDLEAAKAAFLNEERFQRVNTIRISPFITGEAVSMLGCITEQGVLTGPLQLQLIDVPESLHGNTPTGAFFGHDWGYKNWPDTVEQQAQTIVETLGKWLAGRGYKGIFGIDFIYDQAKQIVYPLECNPRSTGAIPAFSQINILTGTPPIDFFTLAGFMNIHLDFNFEAVNAIWKQHIPASHVAIVPTGLSAMKLNLRAGIYNYNKNTRQLGYSRPGAFLHELQNDDEFIIIDQVPLPGEPISVNVPRLFKFIFRASIADASEKIKPHYGQLISGISHLLRQ